MDDKPAAGLPGAALLHWRVHRHRTTTRTDLVGGATTTSDARLGPTIADLDASGAEDEPGLVEEGARSPSPILNILRLNLQCATSTALYAARFRAAYMIYMISYRKKHNIIVL
jgi:hypothetical protein